MKVPVLKQCTLTDVLNNERQRKKRRKTLPPREEAAAEEVKVKEEEKDVVVVVDDASSSSWKCSILAENFNRVIQHAFQRYSHTFTGKEISLVQVMKELPLESKALFIRLFMRRTQWFRTNQLKRYVEITNLKEALNVLSEKKLLISMNERTPELAVLLKMLDMKELRMFAAKAIANTNTKRMRQEELREALRKNCKAEGLGKLESGVREHLGECVAVEAVAMDVVKHMQFTYFLNDVYGLERFVIKGRYPKYETNVRNELFKTRKELFDFRAASRAYEELEEALFQNDTNRMIPIVRESCTKIGFILSEEDWRRISDEKGSTVLSSPELPKTTDLPVLQQCFTASFIHVRIAHHGISLLEKHKRYADAIELIQVLLGRTECKSKRGEWWNRFCIDLEHIGKATTSLEVAEAALADTWLRVGPLLSIQRRILRLGKPPRRWKKPAFAERASWTPKERKFVGRPTNRKRSVKSTFVGFDDADVTVETLAIQYYGKEEHGGWNGLHSENGIWSTIFSLVMWDILFSDLPDVFQHPFQIAPLDLDTDYFYPQRKDAIEKRLEQISAEAIAPELIETVWDEHFPAKTMCMGLNWEKYTKEQLVTIVHCVGGPGLAAMMRLLAQDHKHWRSGMPDLVLWRTEPSYSARLVEVKGPRDTLADHQRAWLSELAFSGLEVEVCKIIEP